MNKEKQVQNHPFSMLIFGRIEIGIWMNIKLRDFVAVKDQLYGKMVLVIQVSGFKVLGMVKVIKNKFKYKSIREDYVIFQNRN